MNRLSKALVILGALFIWYVLIGFWIAPSLIRHFGEQQLQANFSPDSSIAKVRMNPFTGSLRVEGVVLSDVDGAWSVDWQEAELNISAVSLIKFYPVVDALRLHGADLRYEKRFAEVAEDKSPDPTTETKGDWRDLVNDFNLVEIPKLRIDFLEVSSGRVEFVDQTAAEVYRKVVDPINFTLSDLTTVLDDADSTMRFVAEMDDGAVLRWEGDFRSRPIRSEGTFSLSGLAVHDLSPYYSQLIRFHLQRAIFGFGFDYMLDLSDLENLFQLENGHLALTEVLCQPMDTADQLISLDSLALDGLSFSFPEMALHLASVQIESGQTRVFRDEDGEINLAHLVVLPAVNELEQVAEPPVVTSESSLPELSYQIDEISLTDYQVVWEEVLSVGYANLTVTIPHMILTGVSSDLSSAFQLEADYSIGEAGRAHLAGSVVPAGPSLDFSMQIQSVPLRFLSPYSQSFGQTQISAGTFNFDGHMLYDAEGAQELSGQVLLDDIEFVYNDNLQASWVGLDVQGLQLNLSDFDLEIESLVLDQPELTFTNKPASVASGETAEPVVVAASEEAVESVGAPPVLINMFKISQGNLTYIDQSLEPATSIVMDAFNLDLEGLDLTGSKPAQLALTANLNGSALHLDGGLNLNQLKEATHIKASLSGLSLPAFSAYSGQAVGRRIASGSFNLDSDWQVEASQLQASNKIRIEQLKFGDKVDSEDAMSLPLDLAVTLLQGPNGVMDLSLPLSGDLSDPKLGIGQIVRTAVVGLITNVAAAPFKLLSGLAGAGDEDLSMVSFDFGSGKLSPAMVSRLNLLSSALKERPGLNLLVTPQVSLEDEQWLATEQLKSRLLGDSADGDDALFRQRLAERYREVMAAAGTPDAEIQVNDEAGLNHMLEALLPTVELDDGKLQALASARASAIRDHLLMAQGIAAERLILVDPEFNASESAALFDLK
jgi:hypothetical protein